MTLNRDLTNELVLITDSHVNAGSGTGHIYLKFGIPRGLPGGGPIRNLRINAAFRGSTRYTVNFNSVRHDFFDDMPTDHWDHVRLETPSSDGIGIARIILVHSSEEILNLDFSTRYWLDKPYGKVLDLTYDILKHK